eukprot:TRINITY_DN973_c0_g1_i1.p1 TRINITY_DN973_c0_g1~~TRINITY_DN973_c0_g1_i1.p1  ORF type:complete len:404 (+),score=97.63 TRINITY_DN973_c0_g1_i1:113-1324(+)
MATFVDISTEEEQLTQLANYVSGLRQKRNPSEEGDFQLEVSRLIEDGRSREAISRLINEHDTIFSDATDRDIEGSLNVIGSLIRKMEPEPAALFGQKLREAIASNTNDKPQLRLKILNNLFYTFDSSASVSRYEMFITIAKYAYDSGNAELIIPRFKELDKWLASWEASQEQIRRAYKLVHQILRGSNRQVAAHKLLVKYLRTFSAEDAKTHFADLESETVAVAKDAIALDDIHQLDHLLQLEPVRLLQSHAKHAPLYELVRIFATEKLDQYQAFIKEHPGFVESLGLHVEDCTHKMRLLSLASLGAEHEEIPYAIIAQTLQIPEDEVEGWIITAIGAKLIEAKMNQLKKVVVISFCVQRVFTNQQWKQLATKIDSWKANIKQLLSVVQNTKAQQNIRVQPGH